uniref:ORF1 n=1 Tax=Taro bacilliform CH virus TaxID=1634914 RepID=A0A3B1EK22_9VIRU|nr:ORF1 [Taro bacilliform CH virus]
MSDRWENAVQEWYSSRTANLEYLDLSIPEDKKPSQKELAHSLSVVYDRVCLSSRVHLKNFKSILERLEALESENRELNHKFLKHTKIYPRFATSINGFRSACSCEGNSSTTKAGRRTSIQISQELEKKLERVEHVLKKVEEWTRS